VREDNNMPIDPIYDELVKSIEDGDEDAGIEAAKELLASDVAPLDIVQDAIMPCLKDIGDRFARMEVFLPEMMLASDVVKGVQGVLREKFDSIDIASEGKVVIGTVFGDIHDIGKNIVAAVLEANGYEVHNLGVNVEPREFIKKAREVGADLIGLSSLMTTSIPYMRDVIELVKESESDRDRFKLIIGGGPVSEETVALIGADGWGENAADAVDAVRALMASD
jgi:methylmalonyl-CoA mutase cobalamin-binding domain/chain